MGLILPQSIGYWPKRGGGGAPTARSYIQNGLLVQFDAINNVAYDAPQNPSATVWTDLVGGRTVWSVGTLTWYDNYLMPLHAGVGSYLQNSNSYYGKDLGNNYTIESVFFEHIQPSYVKDTNPGVYVISSDLNSSGFGNFFVFGTKTSTSNRPGLNNNIYTFQELCNAKYISASSENGIGNVIYEVNGEIDRVSTNNTMPNVSDQKLRFGSGYGTIIKIHAIRIYDRTLSVEEMKYNFAIDKVRFGLY